MPGDGQNAGFCTIYPRASGGPRPPAVNTTSLSEVGDWLCQSIHSPITFIFSPTTQKINDIPDIDVSVKIFCCLTCYKSFNSFCMSDTGEEVMFQSFQYINTCLHRYNFYDSVSQDNVDL